MKSTGESFMASTYQNRLIKNQPANQHNAICSDSCIEHPLTSECSGGSGGSSDVHVTFTRNDAQTDAQLKDGLSPLHIASFNGHLDVLKTLVVAGANVNRIMKPSTCAWRLVKIPLSYPLCVILLLQLLTTCGSGIILTPSKDQVHVAFENVTGNCIFNCSGNGAIVVWTVDGFLANEPVVSNKGISVLPTLVSPDRRNVTTGLLVPTIKSNNNISVVCTVLDASYRNPQSTDPVILFIQGILGPPNQLKIHVDLSNNMLRLSWIAPPSYEYDVFPAAIFHYVLSNNVSNVPKIINSSCAPSMPCTASIDLNDPLLLMSHNTSILEYNGTIEFTFYAVNGAGNGNGTKYTLNTTRPLSDESSSHPVPTAASVMIANTNFPTNATVQNNYTKEIIIPLIIAMAMGIIVASILIVIFTIKKYKKSIVTTPAAHPEDGSTPNEYIQTLCVTQQDDPYHVVVPLELRRFPHGHNNEPEEHQPQPHIENKILPQNSNVEYQSKSNYENIIRDAGECPEQNINDTALELCQNMVSAEEATSTPPSTMWRKETTDHFEGVTGQQSVTTVIQSSSRSISTIDSDDSVKSTEELIKRKRIQSN